MKFDRDFLIDAHREIKGDMATMGLDPHRRSHTTATFTRSATGGQKIPHG